MNMHSKVHQCPCPTVPAFPSLSVIFGLQVERQLCLWVLSPAFPALSSLLPSSFCQQITMASLSLEATKPTRYLSFLLGAAVITLPGKVACFSLSVRKFTFLFGFVLF